MFSTPVSLTEVEGDRTVEREAVLYSIKGIFEICRWSRQPKADALMDFCWNFMEYLLTGNQSDQPTSLPYPQSIVNNTALSAEADIIQTVSDYIDGCTTTTGKEYAHFDTFYYNFSMWCFWRGGKKTNKTKFRAIIKGFGCEIRRGYIKGLAMSDNWRKEHSDYYHSITQQNNN